MKLIGLAGPARAGKDTVANILADYKGYQTYALATPLRRALTQLLPPKTGSKYFTDEFKTTEIPRLGRSLRYCLQTLGTEWGRTLIHTDLWLMHLDDQISALKEYVPESPGLVVSDVRFDNEAKAILDRGGEVWLITRPVDSTETWRTHASENGISKELVTRYITNEGTLADLLEKVLEQLGATDTEEGESDVGI